MASVLEIVADHDSDAWRAVYTVELAEAIYVLHAFQKKSKKGIATPRQEIALIKGRLRASWLPWVRMSKSLCVPQQPHVRVSRN